MSNLVNDQKQQDLLADLKQDASNATKSNEPQATKEHIAGAQGKLASAMSQARGDSDINTGGQRIAREIEPSGGEAGSCSGEMDRDRIQRSLHALAEDKIKQETGSEPIDMQRGSGGPGQGPNMQKGSEGSRLQSAAEQYDLAREGKQAAPQQGN